MMAHDTANVLNAICNGYSGTHVTLEQAGLNLRGPLTYGFFSMGRCSSTDCAFTLRVLFWACIIPVMMKTRTQWSICYSTRAPECGWRGSVIRPPPHLASAPQAPCREEMSGPRNPFGCTRSTQDDVPGPQPEGTKGQRWRSLKATFRWTQP